MVTATGDRFDSTFTAGRDPGRQEGHPWGAALRWLVVLGIFFFLTYDFANWMASRRAHVPSVVFGWEHRTPFLPWTIIPYWTSDVLYGLSLIVCTTRREVDMQARRLLAAQILSVTFFLAFPLHCAFERPETHGVFGWLFRALMGFDKPYNQAPSLHVSLAVILWSRFAAHLDGFRRLAMTAWLILIGISTMTTYQHQFIDLPTGFLAGLLIIALFPEREIVDRRWQRARLACFYIVGSLLSIALAFRIGGFAAILLWPGAALLTVGIVYAADWPEVLQYPVVRFIAAPYTWAAWANSRWWTRGEEPAQEIADGVWLGRAPSGNNSFRSVVNVAAELHVEGRSIPMLDLVTPTPQQLSAAVAAIEDLHAQRPTLVCCALGYSRSAGVMVEWLVATGRSVSSEQAKAIIRARRPGVVLPDGAERAFDV